MTTLKKKPAKSTPPKAGRGSLKVEYLPTAAIRPSKHNARTHSPAQITAIIASIDNVGWTKPIIIDEKREILAGHGAFQAALQKGMDEVPTIMRSGLTAAQKRAYRIADNKVAEKSEWDSTILAGEFIALREMGFDVLATGFDPTEIAFILQPPPASGPAEPPVPALQPHPASRPGDLWLLGDHRIICGDSTKETTYTALMNGQQASCIFTDPPYGISYAAPSGKFDVIKGDDMRRGQLKKMLQGAFQSAIAHTREDAGWYVWHASATRDDFAQALRDVGLVEMSYIIWEKPGAVLGWSDYRWSHEPCFYMARQGVKPAFYGDRSGTTIWKLQGTPPKGEPASIGNGVIITAPDGRELFVSVGAPKGKKVRHIHVRKDEPILLQPRSDADDLWMVSRDSGHGKDASIHPTMKPIELARKACRNSAQEGEIVLDMFGGSCGTLIACEQTARRGYCIELDPKYVDASVRRWQDMTGRQATHASEKKTFEAIAKERAKAKA